MRNVIAATSLLLLLGGCAAAENEAAETDESADSTPTAESKPDNCETIDEEWGERIADGAEDGVGKIEPGRLVAVKSPDHGDAYFIAMEFTGPGFEDDPEVGIWATNDLTPGAGLIIAVDGFAKNFTVWPDGDQGQLELSSTDQGAKDAVACLG